MNELRTGINTRLESKKDFAKLRDQFFTTRTTQNQNLIQPINHDNFLNFHSFNNGFNKQHEKDYDTYVNKFNDNHGSFINLQDSKKTNNDKFSVEKNFNFQNQMRLDITKNHNLKSISGKPKVKDIVKEMSIERSNPSTLYNLVPKNKPINRNDVNMTNKLNINKNGHKNESFSKKPINEQFSNKIESNNSFKYHPKPNISVSIENFKNEELHQKSCDQHLGRFKAFQIIDRQHLLDFFGIP